ncbi:hypothetical protein [Bartonella saheliensis]|uniref:hypothetical protein n=1 Tax=Bartonella saheliensis TaxID=1457016 RepID=UPI00140E2D78|nr:hypothetical protein [Bartonella saheliensis]
MLVLRGLILSVDVGVAGVEAVGIGKCWRVILVERWWEKWACHDGGIIFLEGLATYSCVFM